MNYNLTDHWHSAKIAAEWPRGSVVLLRLKWDKGMAHSHVYLMSQFFTRHLADQHPDSQFMLIEEPKEKNEHTRQQSTTITEHSEGPVQK